MYKNIEAYLHANTRMCLCVNKRMHKYVDTYTRKRMNTHMCMCAFDISNVTHFRRVQREEILALEGLCLTNAHLAFRPINHIQLSFTR